MASSQSVRDTLSSLLRSPAHKALLAEWRSEDQNLRSRLHRKELNLSSAQAEIHHLLSFFSAFQTFIFSAIAQSNLLKCADWLAPFSLSLIICVGTLSVLHQKLGVIASIKEELRDTTAQADGLFDSKCNLIKEGARYDLNRLSSEPRARQAEIENSNFICKRILTYRSLVYLTVVAVSVVVLISCRLILCNSCPCKK